MASSRARHSSDPLDIEVYGKVRSAQRSLNQAADAIRRANRPRYQTRKAYTQLMDVGSELSKVKSTLPSYLQDPELMPDPDELPEWLRERSTQIELLIRRANESYAMARRCMEVAEQAFNHVELTFAQEEIAQLKQVQRQLSELEANLRRYRGISGAKAGEVEAPEVPMVTEPDVPELEEIAPDVESE